MCVWVCVFLFLTFRSKQRAHDIIINLVSIISFLWNSHVDNHSIKVLGSFCKLLSNFNIIFLLISCCS